MNTAYIYVNGIMTLPGGVKSWTGQAVSWTHLNTDAKAEDIEYFAGPMRRPWKEDNRAELLSTSVKRYIDVGWDVALVGHSNGADVVLDGMKKMNWPKIKKLHLISAACQNDFEKNGLNDAPIDAITVWIAEKDKALVWAGRPFARLLGYGTLGRDGAENATVPVQYITQPIGHSDWFKPEYFNRTMKAITL